MVYEEKTVSSEMIFEGRIINTRLDKIELPDGRYASREIVEHPGGVCVVAVTDENEVLFVKQYRKPLEKAIYEIPAGKLDKGENHRDCGLRELREETGMKAEVFEYLGHIYSSPGFTNETIHIYYAEGLTQGKTDFDEDEFLDVEKIPLDKAYQMVLDGELNDGKTVCGILKYVALKGRK